VPERSAVPGFEEPRKRSRNLVVPDRRVIPHLEHEEPVLARRMDSKFTRVGDSGLESAGSVGTLYLTDRRLIHLTGDPVAESAVELDMVSELSLSGGHLLVTLDPTHGIILDVESPIDFRAQMALAISALRSRAPQDPPGNVFMGSRPRP
jgi:hypothetical protein